MTVAGPPTLIPRGIEAMGCEVRYTLDELRVGRRGLRAADAARAHEPELGAVAARVRDRVPGQRPAARPAQILMHPGPVNRGVELRGEVVDSPQAVITDQVEAGVVVRMAVLYEVLAGAPRPAAPAPRAGAALA